MMDTPTKALIEVIGDSGYTMQLYGADGQDVIEAVNQRRGEMFRRVTFLRHKLTSI